MSTSNARVLTDVTGVTDMVVGSTGTDGADAPATVTDLPVAASSAVKSESRTGVGRPDMAEISSDRAAGDDSTGDEHSSLVGYPPPAPENRAVVRTDPVAVADGQSAPLIWAVSAHGGAGAATLSSRVGFVADAGHDLPSGEYPGERLIVICAAETATGLRRAHRMVLQHMNGLGGDTDLLAVVTHPVNPAWTGRKTPKEIRRRLSLLGDDNLPGQLIRLGWDGELALTFPDEREEVSPADVAEWIAADDKERKRAAKARGTPASTGLTDAAAQLLQLAAAAVAPPPADTDSDTRSTDDTVDGDL
jgi:hypothetical protein